MYRKHQKKVDIVMKKRESMYVNYHMKENLELTKNAELNLEAAEIAWPKFSTTYLREKMVEWLGVSFLANHLQRQQSAVETFGLLNNIG